MTTDMPHPLERSGGGEGGAGTLRRGLAILQAINKGGSVTMIEVAQATNIPYATACRIALTLAGQGLIERNSETRRYRPTALVRTLASGYRDDTALAEIARPHMLALTDTLLWPTALWVRIGSRMMIQFSTHDHTTLTLTPYAAGYTMPIVDCAAGRAWLAFCSEREREMIRRGLEAAGETMPPHTRELFANPTAPLTIRSYGYAGRARDPNNADPGKISSVAVPVFRDDHLVAALELSFFASTMSMAVAEQRFVAQLRATAAKIEADLIGDAGGTVDG